MILVNRFMYPMIELRNERTLCNFGTVWCVEVVFSDVGVNEEFAKNNEDSYEQVQCHLPKKPLVK